MELCRSRGGQGRAILQYVADCSSARREVETSGSAEQVAAHTQQRQRQRRHHHRRWAEWEGYIEEWDGIGRGY